MSTSSWHPGGLVHTPAIAIGSSRQPGQRLRSFSGVRTNFSSVPSSLLAFEFPSSQGPRALHFCPVLLFSLLLCPCLHPPSSLSAASMRGTALGTPPLRLDAGALAAATVSP